MQVNVAQREIVFKVVYYGPPSSGKKTNVQEAHKLLHPLARGRLNVLRTAEDETLYFDVLPILSSGDRGYRIKLKIYAASGQVVQASTRRVILAGADGVAFVADSSPAQSATNTDHWQGMCRYLSDTGLDPAELPMVIQFNKRDVAGCRPEAELRALPQSLQHPTYFAQACNGEGVLETLHGLVSTMLAQAEKRMRLSDKFSVSSEDFLRHVFAHALPHLFGPSITGKG